MTHAAQKMLPAIEIVEKNVMTNCLCILRKKRKICVFDANCILNHAVLQTNKNYGLISDHSFFYHMISNNQQGIQLFVCVYMVDISTPSHL